MLKLNRELVLNTLIKHETLLLSDIAKEENIGLKPNKEHLQFLLDELHDSGDIHLMDGVVPSTYTITDKGIKEGARLSKKKSIMDALFVIGIVRPAFNLLLAGNTNSSNKG